MLGNWFFFSFLWRSSAAPNVHSLSLDLYQLLFPGSHLPCHLLSFSLNERTQAVKLAPRFWPGYVTWPTQVGISPALRQHSSFWNHSDFIIWVKLGRFTKSLKLMKLKCHQKKISKMAKQSSLFQPFQCSLVFSRNRKLGLHISLLRCVSRSLYVQVTSVCFMHLWPWEIPNKYSSKEVLRINL